MKLKRILLTAVLAALFSTTLYATDAKTLKDNMKMRQPKIAELVKSAKVGENSNGLLVILDKQLADKDKKVVEAENADRKEVYAVIAKQQKATPEQVGKRRAAQIAAKAPKGSMVQDSKGKWNKK